MFLQKTSINSPTFISMKDQLVEIHIKIPKYQHDFMQDFKDHFEVNMQDFITKSIKDNIERINNKTKEYNDNH